MKIDQPASSATSISRTAKGAKAQPAAGADAAEQAKDAVQLSSAQVHSLPSGPNADFDAARVADIRKAILAGEYTVHPERIADGLLKNVRDLLSGKNEG
ncbi:anti-sigma28 factor FlgM [Variovorax sp. PBL-H6]|uniref:flagellar biosynthesis anti-sigma factor FlgM n=1 Tax=Variovorax sp. PBL-H6 TaxID=434009 RepID=UPI0013193ECB|nr:flagellar biosynthesis anti-sigma factor FlgM [Variovorax sp. PBL-H6]VTU22233.1 anti-sigma28 factor FlgM [Variovorax sp. PBL-H6]